MRQPAFSRVGMVCALVCAVASVAVVGMLGLVPAAEGQARAILFDNVSTRTSSNTSNLLIYHQVGSGGDYRALVAVWAIPTSYGDLDTGRRVLLTEAQRRTGGDCTPSSPGTGTGDTLAFTGSGFSETEAEVGHTGMAFRSGDILASGCWRISLRIAFYDADNDQWDFGGTAPITGAVYSFFGFANTGANRANAGTDGTNDGPSVSLETRPGDLVIDAVWAKNDGSVNPSCTAPSPQDKKADLELGSHGRLCTSIRYAAGTGQSTTTSWTLGGNTDWALAAASFRQPSPTIAEYFDAKAMARPDGVQVEWQTAYEIDNLGFDVYREGGDGKTFRLTSSPIAGSALFVGPGSPLSVGKAYGFLDRDAGAGAKYWIEDIDLGGQRTRHGPVFAEGTAKSVVTSRASQRSIGLSASLASIGSQSGATTATARRISPRLSPALTLKKRVQNQWWVASQPGAKLLVRDEGWYRVSRAELQAAGFDPGDDPSNLQMYVDGEEIAIRIDGVGPGLAGGDYAVEFFGWGLDRPSTDTNVFWLVRGGQPGRRIQSIPFQTAATGPDWFPDQVRRQDRSVYFASYLGEARDSFFGGPVTAVSSVYTLAVERVAGLSSGTAELEVALQGLTLGSHRVQVTLNEKSLGVVEFEGQLQQAVKFPVELGVLVEGENRVALVAEGAANDTTLVDFLTLTYPRSYWAGKGDFRFEAPVGRTVTVRDAGGTAARVLDITDRALVTDMGFSDFSDAAGRALAVTPSRSYRSAGAESGSRTLLVTSAAAPRSPVAVVANTPSAWHAENHIGARFVIVSHPDFLDAVEPLRALRAGQGFSTAVVDIQEAYDEFSFGIKDPDGIRDLLAHATQTWRVRPEFVLLVGDGTLDPRNHIAPDEPDFVPAVLVPTGGLKTPSDDWYVTFGDASSPKIAIGRLPVKKADEARVVVAKLLAYDAGAGKSEWARRAVVVSDATDPKLDGFVFNDEGEKVRNLLSGQYEASHVSLSRVGRAAGRASLLEKLEDGTGLVAYVGHSSIGFWSNPAFFSSENARALENGAATPVVIDLTCFTGFFANFPGESLGESWLKAAKGGAVAVVTPSSATDPGGQVQLAEVLFQLIGEGASMTLGDALLKAKGSSEDFGVKRGWLLLGDPTMQLRR